MKGDRILTRDDAKSIIRSNTEKVKLPSDFTVISRGALAGFSQMKELTIPEGVRKIETHAFFMRSFKDTSNLEKLTIPSSLTEFGQWCFFGCNRLSSISLPEDFPERQALELFCHVPEATLNFGKKLLFAAKTKTVQQVMDEIGGFLTLASTSMMQVTDGVLEIPKNYIGLTAHAMRSVMSKGVKRLIIPPTLRMIAPNAFSMLDTLEEVQFVDGTTHIDNYALCGCKNLKCIIIPDSVQNIGAGAFMNLPKLEAIRLPASLTEISDELFSGCTALKVIQFGNQIKYVGAGAFYGCTSLQTVMLPESVETIGNSAFFECSALQRLYIPRGAKTLSPSSLCNCAALHTLYMPRIVNDQLEAKRIFGDITNPTITWLDDDVESPQWSLGEVLPEPSAFEEEIPEVPTVLPVIQQAPQNAQLQDAFGTGKKKQNAAAQRDSQADAERIRQLEETIAALKEQVAASAENAAENSQTAQRAAVNSDAIAALNDNLTELQKKVEAAAALGDSVETIANMQEQVAAIASMQDRVEEIAAQQESVQQQVDAIEEIRDKVEAIGSVSDIQGLAEAVSEVQERVEALSDIEEKVDAITEAQEQISAIPEIQKQVEALSGVQEKADAISEAQEQISVIPEIQKQVEALADVQDKVDAITEVQEQISAIPEIQKQVEALAEVQEKVEAISEAQEQISAIPEIQKQVEALSGVQEKVEAIAEAQEQISAIPEIQKQVEALSGIQEKVEALAAGAAAEVQASAGSAVAEHSVDAPETDNSDHTEQIPENEERFDGTAFCTPHIGEYGPEDKVFTHLISKPMPGPKERSAALKDYTVIGYRSFRSIEAGERFEIPEGIRRVETQGFWDSPRLLALELPSSLAEVEPDAFSGCSHLTDVYLAEDFPDRQAVEYFLFRPEIKLHWPKKRKLSLSKARIATVAELMEQYDDILTPEKMKKLQVRSHILQIPEGYTVLAPNIGQFLDMRLDEPEHALKTIILPHSLRRIAARAFTGLESVTHIVMPEGLRIIDMNAFTGCMGPNRIVLPDSVTYIGPFACTAPCQYEQIRLPRTLSYLPENAFMNCNSLVSLRIPETVHKIGEMALAGCTNLASLTISRRFEMQLPIILDGPVKINVHWLEDTAEPTDIQPSESLLSVLEQRFQPVAEQRLFTLEMSNECANFQERLTQLRSHPYIAPQALTEMANATKFEIPLGVLRICSFAFGTNTRLLTLNVPKALTEFEYSAFYGCEKLRDVFLPDEFDRDTAAVLFMNHPKILLSFGNTRPVRVRQLTHDSPWILSSGDSADLTVDNGTVHIPSHYYVIASYMYHGLMGMDDLKRIEVPSSVRLIGSRAFVQLNELEEVICEDGLLAIEPEAFVECENLKHVVLPASVKFLGAHVFSGCTALETVVLPKQFADRVDEIHVDAPHATIIWADEAVEEPVDLTEIQTEDAIPETEPAEKIAENAPAAEAPTETIEELSAQPADSVPEIEVPESIPEIEPAAEAPTETIEELSAQPADSVPEIEVPESIPEIEPAAEAPTETIEELSAQPADSAPEIEPTEETSADTLDELLEQLAEDLPEAVQENEPAAEATTDSIEELPDQHDAEKAADTIDELLEQLADDEAAADVPEIIPETEPASEAITETSEELSEQPADSVPEVDLPEIIPEAEPAAEAPAEITEEIPEQPAAGISLTDIDEPLDSAAAHEPQFQSSVQSDISLSAINQPGDTMYPVDSAKNGEEQESLALDEIGELANALFGAGSEDAAEVLQEAIQAEIDELTESTDANNNAEESVTPEESAESIGQVADTLFDIPVSDITDNTAEIAEETAADEIPESEPAAEAQADTQEAIVSRLADALFTEMPTEQGSDTLNIPEFPVPEPQGVPSEEAMTPAAEAPVAAEPAAVEIPADGKLNTKERRRIYHNESEFTIPAGYTDIRAGAFAGLDDLEVLTLSDTVEKIGSGAFADCASLRTVMIPRSVTSIADDAFDGCDALEAVTMPRELEEAAAEIFGSAVAITWLEPPTPVLIGDGKFTAKARKEIYHGEETMIIPEGYSEIRAGACAGLEDLVSVTLPSTLKKILSGAFADCTALESIVIPKGVISLEEDAFDGCSSLKNVTIPAGLEDIARECFPNAELHIV